MPQVRFTQDHEWVSLDGDIATVGITDHAQQQLGDLVFIELPEVGRTVEAAEACAVAESAKAASDVYSPLAGTVTDANAEVVEKPEIVNQDAESAGWFFKLRLSDPAAFDALMDKAAYDTFVAEHG